MCITDARDSGIRNGRLYCINPSEKIRSKAVLFGVWGTEFGRDAFIPTQITYIHLLDLLCCAVVHDTPEDNT